MHFHLPKPLHGWRALVGEVGIIVIGVLIALGAEQVVEDVHWRHTVAAERKALDDDVASMWTAMSARVVIQDCVDRRLDELELVLDRHKRGQPLGIIAAIGRPGVWTSGNRALQMATGDGSLSHMSTEQKLDYFSVYGSYDTFAPGADEERASWRTLEMLDDPAALVDADWRDLRKAYRDAVDTNRMMKADLVSGTPGQWLTPFAKFPRMAPNKAALTLPWVQELCRPAVKRG